MRSLLSQISLCLLILAFAWRVEGENSWNSTTFLTTSMEKAKSILVELEFHSRNSDCMKEALASLTLGCKQANTNADDLARFAFQLTACHLSTRPRAHHRDGSGQNGDHGDGEPGFECPSDTPVQNCTSRLSEMEFQLYTSFWLHAETICYYIESEQFQERTSKVIGALFQSTAEATSFLNNISKQSAMILDHQNELDGALEALSGRLYESFTKLLGDSEESLLRHQNMQARLLSNFEKLNDVINTFWFIIYFIVMMLLTATKRTSSARPALMFLGVLYLALGTIQAHVIEFTRTHVSPAFADIVSSVTFSDQTLRTVLYVASAIVLVWTWMTTKDFAKENNVMLRQIVQNFENSDDTLAEIEKSIALMARTIGSLAITMSTKTTSKNKNNDTQKNEHSSSFSYDENNTNNNNILINDNNNNKK